MSDGGIVVFTVTVDGARILTGDVSNAHWPPVLSFAPAVGLLVIGPVDVATVLDRWTLVGLEAAAGIVTIPKINATNNNGKNTPIDFFNLISLYVGYVCNFYL
jgi:hypothetical protein